jgi:hypothetical protein
MQRLPKPGDNIHLSDVGYSLNKTQKQRRLSLDKASKKNGSLPILRRLNLIRNLTKKESKNKKKLTKDVNYLKKKYNSKKTKSKSKGKGKKSKARK